MRTITRGVIIAGTSLIMLFISESTSLFGFTESGYRAAIIIAILAEAATTLLLAPVAAIRTTRALARPRQSSEQAFGSRTWPGSGTTA